MITEKDLYAKLKELGIDDYTVKEHPPLFSVEDVIANDCMMPGLNFKNRQQCHNRHKSLCKQYVNCADRQTLNNPDVFSFHID